MASGQTIDKLATELAVRAYDFDPDATTATDVPPSGSYLDMRDYSNVMCRFFRTIGTGATTFKLTASDSASTGGNEVDVVTHAVGSEPDAVGDEIMLECSAEQIADLGARNGYALRYIKAVVSVATNTDEAVVYFIRKGNRPADALSADNVA